MHSRCVGTPGHKYGVHESMLAVLQFGIDYLTYVSMNQLNLERQGERNNGKAQSANNEH